MEPSSAVEPSGAVSDSPNEMSSDYDRRYLSNIAMLLLNKYLLGSYGFRYPAFLTACHMLACTLMSQVCMPLL